MTEQPTTAAGPRTCSSCGKNVDNESVYCHDDYWNMVALRDEAEARTQDGSALAAALYKRDYPRATEPYHEWATATGDSQYADEAAVILGYLALPSGMRPDWTTQWLAALPPSAPPALDEGLLIRAMTIARPFVDFGSPEQYGKRTAAEYARLTEQGR